MKKHIKSLFGIALTAYIMTCCGTPTYVTSSEYNYGDGQPGNYYATNTQMYQQSTHVTVVNQPPPNFNDFYTQLSAHGTWINLRPYGQVWIANVRNFQPYSTNGYWAYTTYGWTWVSNYSWGWAPFHYGRWGYNNRYGWYWVPGYEWGPAWVVWSSSSDMYGWAPLMPGMNYNARLTVNLFPASYWTFMQGRHMGNTNIGGYYMNRSRNVTIINNTTIINNYGNDNNRRYNMGPNTNDVQRYTGRNVQTIRVSSTPDSRSTGVSNGEYRVYRPSTSEGSSRSSNASDNNNRSSTPSTRTTTESNNRTSTPSTRTQTDNNNRSSTPSTRTQTDNNSRSSTRIQPEASPESREYRPTREQPKVTNRAAPQTTRQIQRAQSDDANSQRQQQNQQQPQQRSSRSGR